MGKERDVERQTAEEQETDREGSGRANTPRAFVLLSDVRAVLIRVNPAKTYPNGRWAQPPSYGIIPYGWQIKG